MNNSELKTRIKENFETMMGTLECILDPMNPIKSMVITAASGVGKSYNVIKRLEEAHDSAECNYSYINGKCTAPALFQALWNARGVGSVLLLDDVDVFNSEDKLNILKGALESEDKRIITYGAFNATMRNEGIPQQFEFCGKVIFITNKNLVKFSEGNSELAAHVDAFMTRGGFIDLEIHDNESIMIHIENIMCSTNIVKRFGIDHRGNMEILQFMLDNNTKLLKPSLRMPILIAGLYKKFPNEWKTYATKLCLKKG